MKSSNYEIRLKAKARHLQLKKMRRKFRKRNKKRVEDYNKGWGPTIDKWKKKDE